MNKSTRHLLRAAAERPGVRLLDVAKGLSYGTLRRSVAKLRTEGLIYSARPATVLLSPKWYRMQPDERAEVLEDPVKAAIIRAHGQLQPDVLLMADFLDVSETSLMSSIVRLRDRRILHPWDGLVLTPAGVAAAREGGFTPKRQTGELDTP